MNVTNEKQYPNGVLSTNGQRVGYFLAVNGHLEEILICLVINCQEMIDLEVVTALKNEIDFFSFSLSSPSCNWLAVLKYCLQCEIFS